jgi:soluble lytic murein transglycosylase
MTAISVPLTPTALILAIAATLVLAACSDEPDEQEAVAAASATIGIVPVIETVTPEPELSLTPRPGVLVDLEVAGRYEAEGDIEAAAEAYIAIAASESPDRVEAALAGGRLLIEAGHHEDAVTLLEPLVQEQGPTAEGATGTYLLGRAYASLGRWQEALDQFDAYIAAGGPATPYAYLERSESLFEMERGLEAAQSAQQGLNLGVPASMTRAFILAAAEGYERAGAFADAIANYNLLIAPGALPGDIALGLQRIAALKEVQGDPTYTVERDRLLAEYPASFAALVALEEAEAAGEIIHPVVHGLVLYRHNEYTRAEPYFREQIDAFPASPESAIAYYYLAAIQESRGEIEECLLNYAAVDLTDPSSSIADDALWWRARIHEQDGDLGDAALLYSRIVNEYPSSPFADDAAFRRGMPAYRDGAFTEAATVWQGDVALAADDLARQRLQLWQGKALSRAGQADAAGSVLLPLASSYEDDYFGIRARGLSEGFHHSPRATAEPGVDLTPQWDWTAVEQWMASHTGVAATSRPWEGDYRWARAQELWRVGRGGYGDLEVYALIEAYAGDAPGLYTLSRELLDSGRLSMSARAGQRLLRVLDANPNEGLPRALMSLSYPPAFGPLVQRYADAEGISPLLLLAFIRQESFFDPRAVSPANALGLTQLLPETAQVAATQLGISLEAPEQQLLHADLSLRLGARHMADLLERSGSDVFVALAAYNAGTTAAQRWAEAAGNDADLYLETIEFAETRLYVEIVAENYAIYRYIYGGEAEPNLPH